MEVIKGSNYAKFVEFVHSECSTKEFENLAKLGKTASLRGSLIEFNATINTVLEN